MQHRATRHARGRHRRTTALHSHRAPSAAIGEKSRYAIAAAAVVGVGVAGVTTVTDGASSAPAAAQERTHAAVRAPLVATTAPPTSWTTPATPAAPTSAQTTSEALPTAGSLPAAARAAGVVDTGLPFVAQARKVRPLPLWVDPLPEATVTSCFGPRWGRLHAGVDLAAPDGTRIRSVGAGVVVAAGPAEGYGIAVLIDHRNGYLTHYGHMSAVSVTAGQQVTAGASIGTEGSTGHSTGPHLHFEVHQGTYQNPIEPTAWLHEHGVDIAGCAPAA